MTALSPREALTVRIFDLLKRNPRRVVTIRVMTDCNGQPVAWWCETTAKVEGKGFFDGVDPDSAVACGFVPGDN